jgi:hypothetical protein
MKSSWVSLRWRHVSRQLTLLIMPILLGTALALASSPTSASTFPLGRTTHTRLQQASELPIGVTELLDCVARKQHLAAVMLIDESRSLRTTDSEDRRIDLSRSLAAALRQVSSVPIDGIATTLDLLVVGFSTDVRNDRLEPPTADDWVTIDGSEPYARIEAAIETFRERDLGLDTDYVTALQTAQELLLRRTQASTSTQSPCRAILWFTDGKFDIGSSDVRRPWAQDIELSDSGRKSAVERGVGLLCAPEGIADRLRSADTFLLTFALLSESFAGDDELLLRSVTLGENDCGEADATEFGAYFPGTVPADLVDCFYLALQGRGCNPMEPPTQCSFTDGCPVSFVIDDSTVSIRVEIFALPNTETVTIQPPGGKPIPILGLTADAVPGTTLTTTSSNRAGFVTLAINSVQPGVEGTWTIDHRPVDGGALDVKIIVTPNYRLVLEAPASVVRGDSITVAGTIVGSNGRPIDPATLASSAQVKIEVTDGDNVTVYDAVQVAGTASYQIELAPSISGTATAIGVRANGSFTGADGSRRELATPGASIEAILPGFVEVIAELSIGGVEAKRADDRLADGTQPVLPVEVPAGSITFRAPRDVGGRACVEPAEFSDGSSTRSLMPAQRCVDLDAGAENSIEFRFRDDFPATGVVAGTIRIGLVSALDGSSREVEVPFEGSMFLAPPDPYSDSGRAWWFLILGLLIPLIVYYALARMGSRFKDATLISVRTQEARLTSDGLQVTPANAANPLQGFDYLGMAGSDGRRASGGSLLFHAPARSFRLPVAEVESPNAASLVVTERNLDGPFSAMAALEHQLQGQWVFVAHSIERDRVLGTLSVLVQEPEGVGAEIDRLEGAARSALVPLYPHLVRQFSSGPDPASDSGGLNGETTWAKPSNNDW